MEIGNLGELIGSASYCIRVTGAVTTGRNLEQAEATWARARIHEPWRELMNHGEDS